MKFNQALTDGHREIVQQHLRLVHWTIKEYIAVNESICGLGYDDLYQEGSIALCYAAATYQSDGAQFKTYAVTVIRNHLLDHCRRIAAQRKNTPTISLDRPSREDMIPQEYSAAVDETDTWISQFYVAQILEHGKRTYSGVAKLGIEALELKIKGYSGTDIAALYQTRPNHVGAWISRAAEKLRNDAVAAELLGIRVEKGAPNP